MTRIRQGILAFPNRPGFGRLSVEIPAATPAKKPRSILFEKLMFSRRYRPFLYSIYNLLMAHQFSTSYVTDSLAILRQYKSLAEAAIAQIGDEQLAFTLDAESNSIAIIVKHMAGNMRSRWTDFLTTDGEKPDRNRDSEFEAPPSTRSELIGLWESGWRCVFSALESLADVDLTRTVHIRTEPHSVMQAINRQIAHYAYHVGQIVFLAKHFQSNDWKSLSVPRRKSAEFNARVARGEASQR